MRQRTIQLFALLGISLSPFAVGQQPTTPSPADRTAEISVRGCVSGEKRYTFMQASTGAEFELVGETDRFSPVRGKLIEITGTEYAPRENTNDIPKLRVKKFQVLADKCPIQPGVGSGRATTERTGQGSRSTRSPATVPYSDAGDGTRTPPNVANPNITGDTGSPSPGTGTPPKPPL
jgi:hypothetical protein